MKVQHIKTPSVGDVKVGTLDIWSKLFSPQGEDGSCEFPPDYMLLPGLRFMESVSEPFLPI